MNAHDMKTRALPKAEDYEFDTKFFVQEFYKTIKDGRFRIVDDISLYEAYMTIPKEKFPQAGFDFIGYISIQDDFARKQLHGTRNLLGSCLH